MKRTLYLKVEVDGSPETDPMQDLSDVATWAEVALGSNDIKCTVTAYAKSQDIALDETPASGEMVPVEDGHHKILTSALDVLTSCSPSGYIERLAFKRLSLAAVELEPKYKAHLKTFLDLAD